MIMIKKEKLFALVLFLIAFECFSQNYTDFQYRIIPSIDYKINKKWKVAAEYRYSLQKDLQEFRSSAVQMQIQYNIKKNISLETGYRFTTSFEEDNHRIFGEFQYKKELNDFTLSFASKYQFSTGSFDTNYMNNFKEPVHMFRQKIGLDYNIPKSKASLYVSSEFFLKLKSQPYAKLNRIRYTAGGDYKLKYGNTIGLSLFYDDKVSPVKNDRFVLVTKYNLSINDLVKKKKKKEKKKTSDKKNDISK